MTEMKKRTLNRIIHIASRRGVRLRRSDLYDIGARKAQQAMALVRGGFLVEAWDKTFIPMLDHLGRELCVRIEITKPLRTYVKLGHFLANPVEAMAMLGVNVITYSDVDPAHPASPEAIQAYVADIPAADRRLWQLYATHGMEIEDVAKHIREKNIEIVRRKIRDLKDGILNWTKREARRRVDAHAHSNLPSCKEAVDYARDFVPHRPAKHGKIKAKD